MWKLLENKRVHNKVVKLSDFEQKWPNIYDTFAVAFVTREEPTASGFIGEETTQGTRATENAHAIYD